MSTEDNENYKIKVEYWVAATVVLIGLFFIFQASTIAVSKEAVGPRTMPMALAVALVLGGIYLGVRAFLGKAGDLKEGYGFLETDVARILEVIGSGLLFVFLFWAFGYFVALIGTFIAMLFSFGIRSWPKMIIGSIGLAVVFQWLFMGIMRLNDPRGALINLRPYTSLISGE